MKIKDLGVLAFAGPAGGSMGQRINAKGHAVGTSGPDPDHQHPALWEDGKEIDLGTLGAEGRHNEANDINDHGQVVGTSQLPSAPKDYQSRAFLWQDGLMFDLGTLGGTASRAMGINNRGQVVGRVAIGSGPKLRFRAFLWEPGRVIDLGTLDGFESSWAADINDHGQVVGWCEQDSLQHAFLWQDGKMFDLGTFGGQSSCANAINDREQVVGSIQGAWWPGSHGFLWQAGKLIRLGSLPGAATSSATDINNLGQVVGTSPDPPLNPQTQDSFHAFLWEDGRMTQLEGLGGNKEAANGINDLGQVVGAASPAGQPRRAVLWTRT